MPVDPEEYADTSIRLHDLMVRQIGAKGADFPATLRHSGRLLPRKVRQAGARISEVGDRIQNPKLALREDGAALAEDVAVIERHLRRQNPERRRARARANIAAGLAFQIVVIIAVFIIVLRWRGLV